MPDLNDSIALAGSHLRDADALLITAGAGMGVDSGLPDFRGTEGFWNAYPPYRRLGLRFEQLANPQHFRTDPHLAWGFYGHRMHLYRQTNPHHGFHILRELAAVKSGGYFVFTSNVDGQFAIAGFADNRVLECHGSIHHLQCAELCCEKIWSAAAVNVAIDAHSMRALNPLPLCPHCGAIARPNILMFGDGSWLSDRADAVEAAYRRWQRELAGKKLCIIECGAGTAIPTVRLESERIARIRYATLIRINVRESSTPSGQISIPLPACEAIERIAARV